MLVKNTLIALIGLAIAADATAINPHASGLSRRQQNRKAGGQNQGTNQGKATGGQTGTNNAATGGSGAACLAANAIQTGSRSTGQNSAVAADGQVNSLTDNANFINFCSGKTLTNGLQGKQGSCNGVVMGDIPAVTKMVSTVILNPKNADTVTPNQSFNITVKIANMKLGSFTNATSTYYSAPQTLDGTGVVIGHTHVTVQDVGSSLNPTEPLDAQKFVFFKGINDAGNGAGTLTTQVTGGLPAGNYRVCTMSGASNHQPVLMPVAQRGAQEDCRYFSVAGGGGNAGKTGSNNAGAANNAAAGGTATGGKAGKGGKASATTSAAAAATSAATGGNKGKGAAGANNAAASGALAGVAAPVVQNSGNSARPFSVNGDTFVNKAAAVQRACAIQNNGCANAVNSGKAQGVTVAQCNAQEQTCNAAGGA